MGIVYIGDTPYTIVSDVPAAHPFIALRFSDGSEQYIPSTPVGPSASYVALANGNTVAVSPEDLASSALCSAADTMAFANGTTVNKTDVTGVTIGKDFNAVTALGNNFMRFCNNLEVVDLSGFTSLTSIGNLFISNSSHFNQSVTIPPAVTSIGTDFMSNLEEFNSVVTLPAGLLTIGINFFMYNDYFNQRLILPATITSAGTVFMWRCDNMTNTVEVNCPPESFAQSDQSFATSDPDAPCYKKMIKLAGPYAAPFTARFPTEVANPYRRFAYE